MQLSGNSNGAYKRKIGRRTRHNNRSEVEQPFLLLPNLNRISKVSRRSLTSALIMAIKIGAFIGAFAILFSLVRGNAPPPGTQPPPPAIPADPDVVNCIQALSSQPPPQPPPLPQACVACGPKCGFPPLPPSPQTPIPSPNMLDATTTPAPPLPPPPPSA